MESSITYSGIRHPKELDNDWVDGVMGVSANVPLGQTVVWNNRFTAAFGGSEGTGRIP